MFVVYVAHQGYTARIHNETCRYVQESKGRARLPWTWWLP